MYSSKDIRGMREAQEQLCRKSQGVIENILLRSSQVNCKAREHLVYGIARRLGIISESMESLFTILPLDTQELIAGKDRYNAEAFLHAFLINCSGIMDNIAWFIVFYCQHEGVEKRKHEVGLFHKKFFKYLPIELKDKVAERREWYSFLVGQRHPVAHRIPPYIIPYIEYSNGEIDYSPRYMHSHKESGVVYLHPQLLADLGAVVEFVELLINSVIDER